MRSEALGVALGFVAAVACSNQGLVLESKKGITDAGSAQVHKEGGPVAAGGAPSGSGGQTSTGNGGAVAASTGGQALVVFGTGGSGPDACAATRYQGERIGVDVYVMIDQSSMMSTPLSGTNPPITWWQAVQQGIAQLVNDPNAAGEAIGVQFFPFQGKKAPDSCNANDYATPEVEIGALPGNAAAIATAVENHSPTTFTPTAPALSGAIQHMKEWAAAHPGRRSTVALVTGGFPTECNPDVQGVANIAALGYGGAPAVQTYVIGLETGPSLANLSTIAQAGGTGQATLIDGGDVATRLANAIMDIGTVATPCTFGVSSIPGNYDPGKVVVEYTSRATNVPIPLQNVGDGGHCPSGVAGYYETQLPDSRIMTLCPETCAEVQHGTIQILIGCPAPGAWTP